jgi:hypothetical protein
VLYLALAFVMILPLFGVVAMESGEVSFFVDEPGAPNGASLAYVAHLLVFSAAFICVVRSGKLATVTRIPHVPALGRNLDSYSIFCAGMFAVLAILMVFVYGGMDVLLLNVDKAEFRVSLGPFGAIMAIATKWVMPTMFAALLYALSSAGWNFIRRLMFGVAAACLVIVGASWGFKTTIFFMLLPSIIVTAWIARIRTLILLGLVMLGMTIGFAIYFDQRPDAASAIEALTLRLTALQGDLAWYTWGKISQGHPGPGYLKTFLSIFGDKVLELLTGAKASQNYADWASYYFGPSMTIWGGFPAERVAAGVTNQPTLFAECVIIGGKYFFVLASALFGAIMGIVARWIRAAIRSGNPQLSATLATFFSFTILPWALGNGLASLAYLINVVGGVASYTLVALFFMKGSDPVAVHV